MEINCEFGDVSWVSGKFYTCTINETNIIKKGHVIQAFKGIHQAGKTNKDVKGIWFRDGKINHFPQGLIKHFPNLTSVDLSDCPITEISRLDLTGLEGLFGIYMYNCQLTSLPDNLLIKMPKLRQVSFRNNKIEFASSEFMKPLIGRQNVTVNLLKNKNIDALFSPGVAGSLKSLDELMKLIDEKCMKPAQPDYVDMNPKIKELWTTGKYSDIAIIAGEKKFKAHKTILAMQSVVFAKIFEDQPEANEIKVPDFSSNAVEALLKFIYTIRELDHENAKENFEIAEKFKVQAMQSVYEEIMWYKLDDTNALEFFLLAHRFNSQQLKEEAFNIINNTFAEEIPRNFMEDPEKMKKLLAARRVYEEKRTVSEDQQQVIEESKRAYEEQRRALEERRRAFEEQSRALEKQRLVCEESSRHYEELRQISEESQRVFEDILANKDHK